MNDVELSIRLTADARDATAAVDGVGDSFGRMANEVDDATRKADTASSRLDGVASSAENMDDKAGKATGALGALAAGFEVAGMGNYAAGLETAAMATDGLSGVGQALSLVLELQAVQTARAKAAAIAHAVASKVVAAATRTWAAVQWVLNAAMTANPVGIVVAGVLLLVAAIVLAYRRSERFRAILTAVFKVATIHIRTFIKVLQLVVGWVRDKLPAAFTRMRDIAAAVWAKVSSVVSSVAGRIVGFVSSARERIGTAFTSMRERAAAVFGAVKDKVDAVMDRVVELVQAAKTKVGTAVGGIQTAFKNAFDKVLEFIQPIVDKVQWVIDKLQSLKNIDFTPWNRGMALPAGGGGGGGTTTITENENHFTFYFPNAYVADENTLAKAVTDAVNGRVRLLGGNA